MKKFIVVLLAGLMALPAIGLAQSYTAQAGVSLLTTASASATAVSGNIRLPNFSGTGTLTVTETGITGSPSGCTIKLAFQGNNSATATSTAATVSFTPSTGVQTFTVAPTIATGDTYVATYACSSTYPTAGLITASFSPASTDVLLNIPGYGDPCKNPSAATSSASVSAVTTLAQQVALAAGKQIYVCQLTVALTVAGTAQLEYGTGTNCGTGTTALTGAMNLATATPMSIGWGGAVVTVPAGNALCLVAVTGTANGVISYVQQ